MVVKLRSGIHGVRRVVCVLAVGCLAVGGFRYTLNGVPSSPSMSKDAVYAAESIAFADVDGDGFEELIFVEESSDWPQRDLLKLAHVDRDGIHVKWSTSREQLSGYTGMLVGNVDRDPEAEVVVFCQGQSGCAPQKSTRVYDWHDGHFTERGTNRLSGTLGALMDIDNDGIQEIVLATTRESIPHSAGRSPVTLTIARFTPSGFEVAYTLDLPSVVETLVTGDLNGDGIDEIVTHEESLNGDVKGQLAIYEIDPDEGIKVVFCKYRGSGKGLWFLSVFESGGKAYIFMENRSMWKRVLEPQPLPEGGYTLESLRLYDLRIFRDAIRSTLAYSKDLNQYVRSVDEYTREWMTEDELN